MKIGRTTEDLAAEIMRQANAKRDFIVPTKRLAMAATGNSLGFGDQQLEIGSTAHKQLAEWAGVPAKYYDRMLEEAPALLADNINHWLSESDDRRMLRTLDGKARAFLSNGYRPMDNIDLAQAAFPVIYDLDLMVISAEVTERRLYIKAVDRSVTRELPAGAAMGQGHVIVKPRELHPVVTVSNSEIGFGALAIQGGILDDFCTNLAVFRERSMRKNHVGSKFDVAEGDIYAMLSENTRKLDDAAIWAKVSDVIRATFDRAKFDALVDKVHATQEQKVEGGIPEVVEVTARRFGFNEAEKKSVLDHFIKGADLSRFGLYNAVTRTAEDLADYDRATEFEQIGGDIIDLPASDWRVIAEGNIKAVKLAA